MIKRLVPLLFLGIFLFPTSAYAAGGSPGQIFSVTPIILNARLIPGNTEVFPIEVTNLLPAPLGIHATIENFRPEGETDLISTNGHQDPIISWSTLPGPDIIMNARESKRIMLTVTPPKSAKNGNYYELVFLTPIFDQHVSGTSPQILSRVGVLVSGTIGKPNYADLRSKARISQVKLARSNRPREITAAIRVENTGAYQFQAKPVVRIAPLFGRTTREVIQDKHVLPHSSRLFTSMLSLPADRLFYHVQVSVSVGNGERISKDQWIFLSSYSLGKWSLIWLAGILIVLTYFGRKRIGRAAGILFGKNS